MTASRKLIRRGPAAVIGLTVGAEPCRETRAPTAPGPRCDRASRECLRAFAGTDGWLLLHRSAILVTTDVLPLGRWLCVHFR